MYLLLNSIFCYTLAYCFLWGYEWYLISVLAYSVPAFVYFFILNLFNLFFHQYNFRVSILNYYYCGGGV